MADLKSYSCPKCGSFLDVDRNQDVFDCPFCGNHFTAIEFHRDELIAEARNLVFNGQKAQGLEKYEYLLKLKPNDFDLLYEYACAVDGVGALRELKINTNDPKNAHEKLRLLIKNDPKYMDGVWSEYYTKLYEVISFSNTYNRIRDEYTRISDQAKAILKEKDSRHFYGGFTVIYSIAGLFVVAKECTKLGPYYSNNDIRAYWPALVYVIILAILITLAVLLNIKESKALAVVQGKREQRYNEVKAKADELFDNEVKPALAAYEQAVKELTALEPDKEKKKEADKALQAVVAKKPAKYSNFVKAAPAKKAAVCSKCGGELTLDNENKLYVCNHCGVSYDYSLFVGTPSIKARMELMNGEFDLAEKRYSGVLEKDPTDFEANRGMILCAGKWRAMPDIRLNSKLAQVDWQKVEDRINSAKENANYLNRDYFTSFEQLLVPVKTYIEAAQRPDENSGEIIKSCQKLFRLRYRKFMSMDRDYRMSYQNVTEFEFAGNETKDKLMTILSFGDFVEADRGFVRVLMYHPDDAEALRARVFCAGRWKSVEEISLDQRLSSGLLDLIKARINTAKEAAPEKYSQYFEVFSAVRDVLEENFMMKSHYYLKPEVENEIRERFAGLQSQLVSIDKELFTSS